MTSSGIPGPVSNIAISIMSSAALALEAISSRCGRVGHGVECVSKQVDQNLLDLDPINQHLIVLRVEIEAKLDALFAGAGKPERARFFNQLGKAFNALLRFSARNEVAKTPNDLPGPQRLFGGTIQGSLNLRSVRIGDCQPATGANPSCNC